MVRWNFHMRIRLHSNIPTLQHTEMHYALFCGVYVLCVSLVSATNNLSDGDSDRTHSRGSRAIIDCLKQSHLINAVILLSTEKRRARAWATNDHNYTVRQQRAGPSEGRRGRWQRWWWRINKTKRRKNWVKPNILNTSQWTHQRSTHTSTFEHGAHRP